MARKNEAHDAVVESLTQALLLMMEQKPLAQINISELCEKAGVSRVSFSTLSAVQTTGGRILRKRTARR